MKAAGVTFHNEPKDGGRNRQDILRELMQKTGTIRLWLRPRKFRNPDTGTWEDCIKLVEKTTGQTIGFIPKTEIEACRNINEMTGELVEYKNTIGVRLSPSEKPEQALYWAVKNRCQRTGQKLPVYDRQAYLTFLKKVGKKSRGHSNQRRRTQILGIYELYRMCLIRTSVLFNIL